MISSLEMDGVASASQELENVGGEFALDVLAYCQELHDGTVDLGRVAVCSTYGDVDLLLFSQQRGNAVLAVKTDDAGDRSVVVMFAGVAGASAHSGGMSWDGCDFAALAGGLIRARCGAVFGSEER